MRIHAIIHAPFEKLGIIQSWISKKNYTLSTTNTYNGEQLPDASSFDFLIIMGGSQSLLKLDKYPYLRNEIEWLYNLKPNSAIMTGFGFRNFLC